jgi:hypothetical protein
MKERIKELREQAWTMVSDKERNRGEPYESLEQWVEQWDKCDQKFAELIIREYTEEYQKLVDGHGVVLPKNREHAENMVRVGMFYLENN